MQKKKQEITTTMATARRITRLSTVLLTSSVLVLSSIAAVQLVLLTTNNNSNNAAVNCSKTQTDGTLERVWLEVEGKHLMMSRKKGDSFSSQVIKRLLNALFENGKMKKTSLAANAGINYYMCVKYAKFLAKIGWIEIRPDKSNNDNDVYEYLSITFEGRQKLAILNSEDSSEGNNAAINKSNNNTIIVEDQVFSPSEIDEKICSNNDYYPPAPKIDYVSQNDKIKLLRSSPFLVSMMKGHNHNHHAHSVTSYAKTKANANLMIVDDDTDILLVYNLLLDSCGYNVRVFSDPIEALIHFAKNSSLYDLLILDIRMPQLNGIQLFQTIKSINPNVKVIFVSCLDATPELVSILSEVKQDEILRKPITSEHLIETVQRVLS